MPGKPIPTSKKKAPGHVERVLKGLLNAMESVRGPDKQTVPAQTTGPRG